MTDSSVMRWATGTGLVLLGLFLLAVVATAVAR